jgi:hypothetical protein
MIIREIRDGDIAFVAEHIRGADRKETWESHRVEPFKGLSSSAEGSQENYCLESEISGEPAAITGIGGFYGKEDTGVPWLIGTDRIFNEARSFMRATTWLIDRYYRAGTWTKLINWVDARNVRSRRWLRWLGFREERTYERFGFSSVPFVGMLHEKDRTRKVLYRPEFDTQPAATS